MVDEVEVDAVGLSPRSGYMVPNSLAGTLVFNLLFPAPALISNKSPVLLALSILVVPPTSPFPLDCCCDIDRCCCCCCPPAKSCGSLLTVPRTGVVPAEDPAEAAETDPATLLLGRTALPPAPIILGVGLKLPGVPVPVTGVFVPDEPRLYSAKVTDGPGRVEVAAEEEEVRRFERAVLEVEVVRVRGSTGLVEDEGEVDVVGCKGLGLNWSVMLLLV